MTSLRRIQCNRDMAGRLAHPEHLTHVTFLSCAFAEITPQCNIVPGETFVSAHGSTRRRLPHPYLEHSPPVTRSTHSATTGNAGNAISVHTVQEVMPEATPPRPVHRPMHPERAWAHAAQEASRRHALPQISIHCHRGDMFLPHSYRASPTGKASAPRRCGTRRQSSKQPVSLTARTAPPTPWQIDNEHDIE
jgi:hypothetical protein